MAARLRLAKSPMLAAAVLAAFTTVDLAYNNGPNGATALPTAHYDVLDPATRNPTIAFLKEKVVQNGTRRDRIELAGLEIAARQPRPRSLVVRRQLGQLEICLERGLVERARTGVSNGAFLELGDGRHQHSLSA